jgi:hypothetical protein
MSTFTRAQLAAAVDEAHGALHVAEDVLAPGQLDDDGSPAYPDVRRAHEALHRVGAGETMAAWKIAMEDTAAAIEQSADFIERQCIVAESNAWKRLALAWNRCDEAEGDPMGSDRRSTGEEKRAAIHKLVALGIDPATGELLKKDGG